MSELQLRTVLNSKSAAARRQGGGVGKTGRPPGDLSQPALALPAAACHIWGAGGGGKDMAEVMTERDAVLAANLEFFRAFTTQDLGAMDRLWAREAPASCVHPGWPALHGRSAVMQSWRDILENPDAPHVMCHDDVALLHGGVAIVTCEEELAAGHLAATNVFVKEGGAWRMVHHQATPILAPGYRRRG
jgi:ketosteroid isomerase-like protein